ncbi:CAP domain-containing protein [Xylariales sp. PMI_506]|nr:CAP domain-containing protein [Xylariales sp. PMI_506]
MLLSGRSFITSLLLLAHVAVGGAESIVSTIVVTVAPSVPSEVPQFVDGPTFTSAVLNSTNFYRREHNATAVTWNTTLEDYASGYLNSSSCAFEHSGGPYGENLAIGYANATASVEAWGDEGAEYDYGNPGFSEQTGHFTQLVWKATTTVGCGRRLCGKSGWYLVCEYWPRGNVIGEFASEVDADENAAARVHPGFFIYSSILLALYCIL